MVAKATAEDTEDAIDAARRACDDGRQTTACSNRRGGQGITTYLSWSATRPRLVANCGPLRPGVTFFMPGQLCDVL